MSLRAAWHTRFP